MTQQRGIFDFFETGEKEVDTEQRDGIIALATMIEEIDIAIGRSLQHYASRCDLTLLEAQSLAAIIKLGDRARITAIAESGRIPLSTMTGIASRLEKAGLVERKRASDDARAFVLTLTDKGYMRSQQMFSPFFNAVQEVLRDADGDALCRILDSFATVRDLAEELEKRLDSTDTD